MQEKNAVKPTPVPKRAHALNIIALTQEEAGHALNTARVRKILIGLNFEMTTFIKQYGYRFLSRFGARPNSATLAETPTTRGEPLANLALRTEFPTLAHGV